MEDRPAPTLAKVLGLTIPPTLLNPYGRGDEYGQRDTKQQPRPCFIEVAF